MHTISGRSCGIPADPSETGGGVWVLLHTPRARAGAPHPRASPLLAPPLAIPRTLRAARWRDRKGSASRAAPLSVWTLLPPPPGSRLSGARIASKTCPATRMRVRDSGDKSGGSLEAAQALRGAAVRMPRTVFLSSPRPSALPISADALRCATERAAPSSGTVWRGAGRPQRSVEFSGGARRRTIHT